MIDFTDLPTRKKTYTGANGSKISVIYKGEQYMLKFPSAAPKNKELSYANGCISEYIGCHIFESIGIDVQKTLLGTYYTNGKEKVVVACKDFTKSGVVLQDFASLKNTIIDSEHNGYGTELNDIMKAIAEQQAVEPRQLKEWCWDVCVVDALIGNWDRHNGNWGFLYNVDSDEMTIAPVFDCGSCLYPQADETIMKATLESKSEQDLRIFSIPLSGIKINNSKINYFEFISSLENDDCNKALKRILPKINMEKINSIIDKTPYITDLQKDFYKVMLSRRKEKILDFSYNKLLKIERTSVKEKLENISKTPNLKGNKNHSVQNKMGLIQQ